MAMVFPAAPGFREISYLFVDVGCLREAIKPISLRYLGDESAASVDWGALRAGEHKVFVYDAVFAQERGESQSAYDQRIEARMAELRAVRGLDSFHVQLGDLRGKKAAQKKVDVMIAVDMLSHTFRRNMHKCTLLTGDSDFQPLLEALTREGMFTTLWHPPQAPDDLKGAADAVRPLRGDLLPLLRPDGTSLVARERIVDIRPRDRVANLHVWRDGPFEYCFSRTSTGYRFERYNPMASASSEQIGDTQPKIVLATAEDQFGIALPADVREALKKPH